jgi:hypothetical protein
MLRIFRGERHVEGATQPGQGEQGVKPQADQATAAADTTKPPQRIGNGHAEMPAQALPPSAAGPAPQGAAEALASQHEGSTGPGVEEAPAQEPGFLDRGRIRRRARFLHAARELAYRDLGGLVFDLHRFGQRNDDVVNAKLETLSRIDSELRILEAALSEHRSVTVLRQAGVAACPRCAAIHGSGDRFCPACGLAVDQTERPIAGPNAPAPAPAPHTAWQPPSTAWQAPGAPASPIAPPWTDPRPGPPAPSTTSGQVEHTGAPPPIPDPSSAGPAGPGTGHAHPEPPAAPANVASSGHDSDSQTEVIRSGRTRPRLQQRTVAFDPVPRPAPEPDGAPEDGRGKDGP